MVTASDSDFSGVRIGKCLDPIHGLSKFIEYRCAAVQQGAAGLRQLDAGPMTLEESGANGMLKLRDQSRDRGLSGVEGSGCFSHAAGLHDSHQHVQIVQLQAPANSISEKHRSPIYEERITISGNSIIPLSQDGLGCCRSHHVAEKPAMRRFGSMLKIAVGALALCVWASATLAETYPTRIIKLVVPAPPGGPMDLYGRLAAQIFKQGLGATVVVENRPGAGGATATKSIANATPDGYTLLVANTTTLGVIPATTPDVGFDPVKSFAPVAKLADSATALVVPSAFPADSIGALVEYAKREPGKLNYASVGIWSLPHLQAEIFKLRTGTDIVHVPFKSGPEMVTAILGQHVDMAFAEASVVIPLVKEQRIKALAVSSLRRQPKLVGVPTMIESGIVDFVFPMWTGIVAPAGTSPDILEHLNRVIQAGLESPQIAEALASSGAQAASGSAQSFSNFLNVEAARWSEIVRQTGIKDR